MAIIANIFPDFAYSSTMQVILFFVSCINTIVNYVCITDLISIAYGEKISFKRKFIFAVIIALGLNQFWVYGIFALGNFVSFSPLAYAFIVTPNPFFAILYYWFGTKVLGLFKYRSVRLMRIVYLYVIILRCLGEFIGVLIIGEANKPPNAYNYLLDAVSCCTYTAIYVLVYIWLRTSFKKNKFQIQLIDRLPIKRFRYEQFISFVYACVIYLLTALIPYYFDTRYGLKKEGFLIVGIFLTYVLAINTLTQHSNTVKNTLDNKNINMRVLMKILEDFSEIKHDFFNVLQTYEGYIAIGDIQGLKTYHEALSGSERYSLHEIDLTEQWRQNPQLTALLIEKQKLAKNLDCTITLNISCDIKDFYIPNEDLCSAVSNLLDSSIQERFKGKNIIFSVNQKPDNAKLIMINVTNVSGDNYKSTSPYRMVVNSNNNGEDNLIVQTRKILFRYNNVFFHGAISKNSLFSYIELQQVKK